MAKLINDRIHALRKIAPELYLLLGLFLLAIGLWFWAYKVLPKPVEVVALAVGKGDAFLIRGPTGRTVLIDGGSSSIPQVGERILVPNLMLHGIDKLDAIMVTHPDSDHINGFPAVLQALHVKMLLDPGIPDESAEYQQLVALAQKNGIRRFETRAGDVINLGHGARLRILGPAATLLTGTDSDSNNNSLVCMLEYRHTRMLFTGDLEQTGEQHLLDQHLDLHADVLKVAHHGSRNGTMEAFLKAVNPDYAVISCPGSTDHPSSELLARLRAKKVHILRTDVQGELTLKSDGDHWTIDTFKK